MKPGNPTLELEPLGLDFAVGGDCVDLVCSALSGARLRKTRAPRLCDHNAVA